MAKLSKAQQKVVDKLLDGWELGNSMSYVFGGPWLQKGGIGAGGDTQKVHENTLNALVNRGIVVCVSRKFPTAIYHLSEEFRNATH